MFYIGCHLSITGGYYNAAKVINSIGGNCFQYFSRNPQGGGSVKEVDPIDIKNFIDYANEHNIIALAHAPYTLNPCSATESTRDFAKIVFKGDIKTLEKFPNPLYNFHPGSHTTLDRETGINKTIEILNEVISPEQKTIILLETMSGKGSEIGITFEEIKQIIDGVIYKDKIGVCLDTCHIYSAGYDIVNNLDGVVNKFDQIIGLKKLKAIHLNDSKMDYDSKKDRHEIIGSGTIGKDAIIRIINHPLLRNIPFFLETPNELDGYKKEIEFLKQNRID